MQIHENTREILCPLYLHDSKGRPEEAKLLIIVRFATIIMFGLGIMCVGSILSETWSNLPIITDIISIGTLLVMLAWTLWSIPLARGVWSGTWKLNITHEGIFYSYYVLSTLIRWDEITILASSSINNTKCISIGVKDEKAIFRRSLQSDRGNSWKYVLHAVLLTYESWRLRSFYDYPSSIILEQKLLPMPAEHLIWLIQERFAEELREHPIEILKKTKIT